MMHIISKTTDSRYLSHDLQSYSDPKMSFKLAGEEELRSPEAGASAAERETKHFIQQYTT